MTTAEPSPTGATSIDERHLSLRAPPSINACYRCTKHRSYPILSSAYRSWIKRAKADLRILTGKRPLIKSFICVVRCGFGYNRDPDNILKPVLDALQEVVVINDKWQEGVAVVRDKRVPKDEVLVYVREASDGATLATCLTSLLTTPGKGSD